MNRQKIERIKERIEFINKDIESLKTNFTDSAGDIKAQAAEYIYDNEEEVTFLQSLLDEPEEKDNITETIQSFLKNATDEELQKILKESDPDGVFAQIKDKVFSDQQPLDAPTHSGWWWSSKAGNWPLYYNHDEGMINDRGMWLPAASFLGGKWLPANNPLMKGEG